MKLEQYQEFLKDPAFLEDHVFEINPLQIVKYRQTARSKGEENINASIYYAQFRRGVPQVAPVSVIPIGWCAENDWELFECCDGMTRTEGGKKMVTKCNPDWKLKASNYQHAVLKFSAQEWEDFSDSANDHNSGQPNTDEDMLGGIQRRIESGWLDSVVRTAAKAEGMKTISIQRNKQKYIELAATYFINPVNGIYKNTRRTMKWFKNRIEASYLASGKLVTVLQKKSEEWNLGEYAVYGGTSYDEKLTAVNTSNNEKVFLLSSKKYLTPNMVGQTAHFHTNHPQTEITIVMHFQDIADKDNADIAEMRDDAVAYLTKMNSNHGLGITRIVSTAQTVPEEAVKGTARVVEHWSAKDSHRQGWLSDDLDNAQQLN